MARPVVSGNDLVYAFSNPYGTGLRVTNPDEAEAAVTHLLDHELDGDAMGKAGRDFVRNDYHEDRQREDLHRLLAFLQLDTKSRTLTETPGTSHHQQTRQDFMDKIGRKSRQWLGAFR